MLNTPTLIGQRNLQRMQPAGFNVIVDSAGEGFGSLLRLLGMAGRLVFFGELVANGLRFCLNIYFSSRYLFWQHDRFSQEIS